MNSREFLSTFSDKELAFFYRYKIDLYLDATKLVLQEYIFKERGLSAEWLLENSEHNVQVASKSEACCPRCASFKISSHTVPWQIPMFEVGAENELAMLHETATGSPHLKMKVECLVCGYVLVDPNNSKKSVWKKIMDFTFNHPIWSLFMRE